MVISGGHARRVTKDAGLVFHTTSASSGVEVPDPSYRSAQLIYILIIDQNNLNPPINTNDAGLFDFIVIVRLRR